MKMKFYIWPPGPSGRKAPQALRPGGRGRDGGSGDALHTYHIGSVIAAEQRVVLHLIGGGGGVDKLIVPHIDAHMGGGQRASGTVKLRIEEIDQIAGLHLAGGDEIAALVILAGGAPGNGVAQLPVDVIHQARAVKAIGASRAVHIGLAHQGGG